MAASQVNMVSQVWGCVHLSYWNAMSLEVANLDISTSSGPVNKFVFNCFVSLLNESRSIVLRLLLPSPRVCLHAVPPWLIWHEGVSSRTNDLQLPKMFPLWQIHMECVGTKVPTGGGIRSWGISDEGEHFMFRSHLDVTSVCVDQD